MLFSMEERSLINESAHKVASLIDTCIQLIEWIREHWTVENFEENLLLLQDLENALRFIINLDTSPNGRIKLYCKNVQYSIKKLQEKRILAVINLEIIPLLYEVKKMLVFSYEISKSKEILKDYDKRREAVFKNYSKGSNPIKYKYKVSIIVTAYNKLEYTKKAIESIYKYTDFKKLNVELITINNGSTDGTEEYFNRLPNEKKISFQYNMLGNTSYMYNIEGEYWVGFSNDVVATQHWLENLLTCMQANPKVVYAVPTCNSDGISCEQGVDINYEDNFVSMDKMEKFALDYNRKSNPRLWEERSILMPFIAIVATEFTHAFIKNNVEQFDNNRYVQHEFVDDDLSTSLRRAGLKQILAKDTFMHHFGSVTLGEAQCNSNSLDNMREVYYKKWGVDAWDSRCYLPGIEMLLELSLPKQNPKLLFIEPRFGGGSLQIKNCLRRHGILPGQTVGMVVDQRYIEDAVHMYDETISGSDVYQMLDEENRQFDIIAIGSPLHDLVIKDVIEFLESLYKKLTDNGKLIFLLKNYRNAKVIIDLLGNNMPGDCGFKNIGFSGIHCGKLMETIKNHEFLHHYSVLRIGKHTPEVDAILNIGDSYQTLEESQKKAVRDEFGTDFYIIMIEKVI